MGFPRQKVKARRVAPSEPGNERVSICFQRRSRVPAFQIQIFRDQRAPGFLIQKSFSPLDSNQDARCAHASSTSFSLAADM
jgi:hypothetical protein